MRFRDHPRMIANRAVQLEGMLERKGHRGAGATHHRDLSQVPGETRYVESFGALTQQYYNLRMEGLAAAKRWTPLKRARASARPIAFASTVAMVPLRRVANQAVDLL